LKTPIIPDIVMADPSKRSSREWKKAVEDLINYWRDRERPCPKCGQIYKAEGNRGGCPNCGSYYYASNPGVPASGLAARDAFHLQIPDFPDPAWVAEKEGTIGFDVDEMEIEVRRAIDEFCENQDGETYYAFAIDASMLCLNSVEAFERSLAEYLEKYPRYYETAEQVEDLRLNSGDWDHQGFSDLDESHGFSEDLYQDHYDLGAQIETDEDREAFARTPYALAMNELLERLKSPDAFTKLKRTEDFRILRVEHNY
jgi:predicted  nucleic acid-binding Zn-ribbon protein